ncbi:MAG: UDP-N-acetylmuramoyl-tripeptide--D-alanyl-D-alanine ligase, partial [bacterium]
THGHEFIEDAVDRGASGAIVEEKQPIDLPQFVSDDSARALQTMARIYRDRVVDPYVIGVTGSCGKTTLKTMLADVLETNHTVGRTPGNFNNQLGVPLTILNEADNEILVAEVATNAPGEIGQLSRWVKPDMGIITHIGPAHLQGLESVEKVAREKSDLLAELSEDGIALVPEWLRCRQTIVRKSAVLPRSVGDVGSLEWETFDQTALLRVEETDVNLDFGATGLVRDAVLAAAAGLMLGVAPEQIKNSLESFEPLSGRGETREIDGTKVIDGTYNANPDSMRDALDRLAGFPPPRLAVLGDMKELGDSAEQYHRDLASYASDLDGVDLVYVGSFEPAFREGLENHTGRYRGVSDVQELNGVSFGDYRSVLLKASRAVGLDQLLNRWTDQS